MTLNNTLYPIFVGRNVNLYPRQWNALLFETIDMQFSLLKSQGSGNDFFLIDIRHYNGAVSDVMKKQLAIHLCDRNSDFGADGILYVDNSTVGDGKMVIFNADGSEAEMCGNGIRIVARYVSELLEKPQVIIENKTGIPYPLNLVEDFYPGLTAFELTFPKANFDSGNFLIQNNSTELINGLIPELSSTIKFTALSLPNPHIVAFVDDIVEEDLRTLGQKANSSPQILPHGVNVNFGKIISDNSIYVATYERGVGLTYSCGTGMFATTLSAVNAGHVKQGEWITLFNKGGYTKCLVNDDLSGRMIGNASYIYATDIEFDFENNNIISSVNNGDYSHETGAYKKLLAYVNQLV
jgi:diaminopimelate epimerase